MILGLQLSSFLVVGKSTYLLFPVLQITPVALIQTVHPFLTLEKVLLCCSASVHRSVSLMKIHWSTTSDSTEAVPSLQSVSVSNLINKDSIYIFMISFLRAP